MRDSLEFGWRNVLNKRGICLEARVYIFRTTCHISLRRIVVIGIASAMFGLHNTTSRRLRLDQEPMAENTTITGVLH
jgi:hypothetical protein